MFSILEKERILYAKSILEVRLEPLLNDINENYDGDSQLDFWVSGGCIASILQGAKINDIDVYFNNEITGKTVKDLYIFRKPNEIVDVNPKYQDLEVNGKMVTSNAVTLKNGIQIITKHYGSPAEVRKTFDYKHCLPYYDCKTKQLFISVEQYALCVGKILDVNNPNAVTQHRKQKFLDRGYVECTTGN